VGRKKEGDTITQRKEETLWLHVRTKLQTGRKKKSDRGGEHVVLDQGDRKLRQVIEQLTRKLKRR